MSSSSIPPFTTSSPSQSRSHQWYFRSLVFLSAVCMTPADARRVKSRRPIASFYLNIKSPPAQRFWVGGYPFAALCHFSRVSSRRNLIPVHGGGWLLYVSRGGSPDPQVRVSRGFGWVVRQLPRSVFRSGLLGSGLFGLLGLAGCGGGGKPKKRP